MRPTAASSSAWPRTESRTWPEARCADEITPARTELGCSDSRVRCVVALARRLAASLCCYPAVRGLINDVSLGRRRDERVSTQLRRHARSACKKRNDVATLVLCSCSRQFRAGPGRTGRFPIAAPSTRLFLILPGNTRRRATM
ncbi:hypothetical protein MRX96_058614 [Rhipicephalus microplus]